MQFALRVKRTLRSRVLCIICAAGVLSAVFFISSCSNEPSSLPQQLSEMDRLLALSQLVPAKEMILDASKERHDTASWMRLCRRAYDWSVQADDYSLLRDVALRAQDQYSSREEFTALMSYASLRSGLPVKSDAREFTQQRFAALDAELVLSFRGGLAGAKPYFEASGDPALAALGLLGDPDGDIYRSAAEASGDIRLYKNAVAALASDGRIGEAWNLYVRELEPIAGSESPRSIAKMGIYLAMDQGEWASALQRIRSYGKSMNHRSLDMLLWEAQAAWKSGRPETSLEIYNRIVAENPDSALEAHLNRITLLEMFDGEPSADDLNRLVAHYPDSHDAVMAASRHFSNRGDHDRAREILSSYCDLHPDDASAALARLDLDEEMELDQKVRLLWSLVHETDFSDEVAVRLAWSLAGSGRMDELERLLSLYGERQSNTGWDIFYRSVYMYSKGLFDDAAAGFAEAESGSYYYCSRMNRILSLSEGENPGPALDLLIPLSGSETGEGDPVVWFLTAGLKNSLGDTAGAKRALAQGKLLDPIHWYGNIIDTAIRRSEEIYYD